MTALYGALRGMGRRIFCLVKVSQAMGQKIPMNTLSWQLGPFIPVVPKKGHTLLVAFLLYNTSIGKTFSTELNVHFSSNTL